MTLKLHLLNCEIRSIWRSTWWLWRNYRWSLCEWQDRNEKSESSVL